jgi:hypothetical protein
MTTSDCPFPQEMRPAARVKLAAAGPVEPSSSPGLAPGPTFFLPPRPCDHHCADREAPVLGSRSHARIVETIAVEPAAAWCWLHSLAGEANVPTLAFVPGIIISGRYRMCPPS